MEYLGAKSWWIFKARLNSGLERAVKANDNIKISEEKLQVKLIDA